MYCPFCSLSFDGSEDGRSCTSIVFAVGMFEIILHSDGRSSSEMTAILVSVGKMS